MFWQKNCTSCPCVAHMNISFYIYIFTFQFISMFPCSFIWWVEGVEKACNLNLQCYFYLHTSVISFLIWLFLQTRSPKSLLSCSLTLEVPIVLSLDQHRINHFLDFTVVQSIDHWVIHKISVSSLVLAVGPSLIGVLRTWQTLNKHNEKMVASTRKLMGYSYKLL